MNEPVAFWHAEHEQFSRLLDAFERQLARFHDGEQPNYELMRDIVQYLRDYPDHFHHPREDVAFDRLLAHDPSMEPQISRLRQEHRVVAQAGATLLERLREVTSDAMMPRGTIESAAATYLVYYRHHLASEEADVLPRAAQLLTPEDWGAVAASVKPGPDPLFGADPAARFKDLRRHLFLAAASS